MRLDEVYQAALEAGSGGIRWNSENNYIQLMDENKNWIDYKKFDPNSYYIFKSGEVDTMQWIFSANSNGRYVKTPEVISLGSVTYGSGSSCGWTATMINLSGYNTINFKYICNNNNMGGPNIRQAISLNSTRPTSHTNALTNAILDRDIGVTTIPQIFSVDISDLDLSVYLVLVHGDISGGNMYNYSEIYLSN